jgi:hypothetical protein
LNSIETSSKKQVVAFDDSGLETSLNYLGKLNDENLRMLASAPAGAH